MFGYDCKLFWGLQAADMHTSQVMSRCATGVKCVLHCDAMPQDVQQQDKITCCRCTSVAAISRASVMLSAAPRVSKVLRPAGPTDPSSASPSLPLRPLGRSCTANVSSCVKPSHRLLAGSTSRMLLSLATLRASTFSSLCAGLAPRCPSTCTSYSLLDLSDRGSHL